MPRVALHTLGCKLNFAETATIGKQFLDRGFEIVPLGEAADVCVINTCTVTERADRECRQIIRRALRSSSQPFVIVTGCYAQLEPEAVASIAGVDAVLGAKEKFDLFRFVGSFDKTSVPMIHVSVIDSAESFGPAFSTAAAGRTRAFLKIQDGCDYSCSFCTIPLARGASRSQPPAATLHQARQLVAEGYKEIVLTGVNVGDYGSRSGERLLSLLEQLARIEGLERLRISSIEPNLLHDDLIGFVASESVLCNHFHVPLQSGDDDMLRRMRRRYTTDQYAERILTILDAIPECGIGVDVIVGFPGETDAHFERTYRFLNELPVSYLHVFTYSERPRTPAASFGPAVPMPVRQERNSRLRILSQKKRHIFYERFLGTCIPVLFESDVEKGLRFGLSGQYVRVAAPAWAAEENSIKPVLVTSVDADLCRGTVVGTEASR